MIIQLEHCMIVRSIPGVDTVLVNIPTLCAKVNHNNYQKHIKRSKDVRVAVVCKIFAFQFLWHESEFLFYYDHILKC